MWILYQVLHGLALVLAAPFLLLRRGAHYLQTIPGRLTFPSPPAAGAGEGSRPLWVHAVSVGETGVAATLVAGLEEAAQEAEGASAAPFLVTTVTPTGQARAKKLFADRAGVAATTVAYLPYDLAPLVGRFFRRHRPRALVLVEGDYWPAVLRRARRRGLPVVVVNGRVGDRSFRRLARLGGLPGGRSLLRLFFAPVDRFGVQSAEDRRRLAHLGVPEDAVVVTGNLKYETPEPPPSPGLDAHVGRLAAGRPVLVAGSTMDGEEERVLAAYREATSGEGSGALLVIAPRHPERWEEVARLVEAGGFATLRRSRLGEASPGQGTGGEAPAGPCQVLLLDSLGELAGLYRLADAAFIGGTLVPTGGHNPLEAARFGIATAVGPSMENFRDMAAQFDRAGAWARAADAGELGRTWRRWLEHPEVAAEVGRRARTLVEENRGALGRTVEMLRPLLAEAAASGDGGGEEGDDDSHHGGGRA